MVPENGAVEIGLMEDGAVEAGAFRNGPRSGCRAG